MSKELKLNKGDRVSLAGKEYEVTVVGKNQVTLKNADGKQRRVALSSTAYAKIKVIEAVTVTEDKAPTKAKKRRLGSKSEDIEPIEIDFDQFEQQSYRELKEAQIDADSSPKFKFYREDFIQAWIYSIQRATKGQRIAYIEYKLKQLGKDSLFGLMIALYKVRNRLRLDYSALEYRILADKVHQGKRAKTIRIRDIIASLEPVFDVPLNKITQQQIDDIILTIPDDGIDAKQGWIVYMMTDLWVELGTLKLSQQDLANIEIPMA